MLANQISSGWDEAFIILNALLAGAAFATNLAAAWRAHPFAKAVHSAIAALALVYVVGYLYLELSDVSVEDWSSVMRGVSLAAWVIAWIGPAYVRVHRSRSLPSRLERAVLNELTKRSTVG